MVDKYWLPSTYFANAVEQLISAFLESIERFQTSQTTLTPLRNAPPLPANKPDQFLILSTILVASVIQADGNIRQEEVEFAKQFLLSRFGEKRAEMAFSLLSEVLRHPIQLEDTCHKIRYNIPAETRRELIYLLLDVAKSDGNVDSSEVKLIHSIAAQIGFPTAETNSLFSALDVQESPETHTPF